MNLDAGRILVVDDEPAIRRLLRSTWACRTTPSWKQPAWRRRWSAGREKVDLIFLIWACPTATASR